jgi:hypothetical protein
VRAFSELDPERTGKLSRSSVSKALCSLGVNAGADASLNAMLDGAGCGQDIEMDAFVRIVRVRGRLPPFSCVEPP